MMFERMTKGRLKWNPEQVSMAAIFVGALSLRLFYLMENRGINPFFDAPIVDARSYLELAQRIVGGDWMGGDIPFWQPPAFPYLLALVVGICGDSIFTAARVGHAILGASSTLLVYRLARRPCDRATATLAAVGTALYGPLLYFEAELLSVALEVFLYLLLLLMLARAQERNQPLDWVLAGLTAGLATITRPNVLIFVLPFADYMLKSIYGDEAYINDACDFRVAFQNWKHFQTVSGEGYWRSLRGRDLEWAAAGVFRERGWKVSTTATTGDGGVDLVLKYANTTFFCQCKGHVKPVSVGAVREIAGVCAASSAIPMLIVVNGVTGPALTTAKELSVVVWDRAQLAAFARGDLALS